MSGYSEIDPILGRWAARNDLRWIRDDRGWDVRTLFWPLAHPETVQLWLDEPTDGEVAVHVCQNTTRGGQHRRDWRTSTANLEGTLDEALEASLSLVAKLKGNMPVNGTAA